MPVAAPDRSARWLYHDVLVAIDPERSLNNGMPSLWARIFDHLQLRKGSRVLQVGAGTGYYTAVIAEMVGPHGRAAACQRCRRYGTGGDARRAAHRSRPASFRASS